MSSVGSPRRGELRFTGLEAAPQPGVNGSGLRLPYSVRWNVHHFINLLLACTAPAFEHWRQSQEADQAILSVDVASSGSLIVIECLLDPL